jgi:ABC-type lipoprotein release transport system permease subunit
MIGMYVKIAWRNVFRNRRRSFIVIGSVSVGVAGAIFMNLFMAGMAEQMIHTAINSYLGHIQVHREGFADNPVVRLTMTDPEPVLERIRQLDGRVKGYAPRVLTRGLAQSATNSAGVQMIGVEAARESLLTSVSQRIVEGTFLTGQTSIRRKEIVIGNDLARKLDVAVGKKVVLVAQALGGEMGSGAFRVVGIFRMPSEELNKGLVWINLSDAQQMLGLGDGLSEVMVMLHKEEDLAAVQNAIAAGFDGEYEVLTWREVSAQIVQIIDLFDVFMFIMMVIIFFAAAFGIINTMLMAVFERTREFGILRAVGTGRWVLFRMVVYEAAFIGLLGLVGGTLLMGILHLAFLQDGLNLSIFERSLALFGSDAVIRPYFRLDMFIATVLVVEGMTVLASVWPALRAARLQPADAIRRH